MSLVIRTLLRNLICISRDAGKEGSQNSACYESGCLVVSLVTDGSTVVLAPVKAHSMVCLVYRGKKPTEHEPGTDFSFLLIDSNLQNP